LLFQKGIEGLASTGTESKGRRLGDKPEIERGRFNQASKGRVFLLSLKQLPGSEESMITE
jgi:hypothetical protein